MSTKNRKPICLLKNCSLWWHNNHEMTNLRIRAGLLKLQIQIWQVVFFTMSDRRKKVKRELKRRRLLCKPRLLVLPSILVYLWVKIMQPSVFELWTFFERLQPKMIPGDLRSLGGYPRFLSASSLSTPPRISFPIPGSVEGVKSSSKVSIWVKWVWYENSAWMSGNMFLFNLKLWFQLETWAPCLLEHLLSWGSTSRLNLDYLFTSILAPIDSYQSWNRSWLEGGEIRWHDSNGGVIIL